MEKMVKIGNKEYKLKSSAFTMFKYKNDTGKDLLKEIGNLNEKYKSILDTPEEKRDEIYFNEFYDIMYNTLRLAHIMIQEADSSFMEYEEWLKNIDNLMEEPTWVVEVLQIAMSTFRGGNQAPSGNN